MKTAGHQSGRDGDVLTTRELEVLERVASGARSQAIAAELGLSEATVKSHLSHIYRKLAVRNRVEAAGWFFTNQLERAAAPSAQESRARSA
jgi:DNA-binding NarL/FixJ family response regulator